MSTAKRAPNDQSATGDGVVGASHTTAEARSRATLAAILPDALDCLHGAVRADNVSAATLRTAQWVVQLGLDGQLDTDTPEGVPGLGAVLSLVGL